MSASYTTLVPVTDFAHAQECGSTGDVEVGVDEAYAWFTCVCGDKVEVLVSEYLEGSVHEIVASAPWMLRCACGVKNSTSPEGRKLFAEHFPFA